MKMAELPIAPITKIVRNAGAQRVSGDASEALVRLLGAEGARIAKKAVALAKHAGRKTVKAEDIRIAAEEQGYKKIFVQNRKEILKEGNELRMKKSATSSKINPRRQRQILGPHDLGFKIVRKNKKK